MYTHCATDKHRAAVVARGRATLDDAIPVLKLTTPVRPRSRITRFALLRRVSRWTAWRRGLWRWRTWPVAVGLDKPRSHAVAPLALPYSAGLADGLRDHVRCGVGVGVDRDCSVSACERLSQSMNDKWYAVECSKLGMGAACSSSS